MPKKISDKEVDSMTSFLQRMRKPGESTADVAMKMAKLAGASTRRQRQMERMLRQLKVERHVHTIPLEVSDGKED